MREHFETSSLTAIMFHRAFYLFFFFYTMIDRDSLSFSLRNNEPPTETGSWEKYKNARFCRAERCEYSFYRSVKYIAVQIYCQRCSVRFVTNRRPTDRTTTEYLDREIERLSERASGM